MPYIVQQHTHEVNNCDRHKIAQYMGMHKQQLRLLLNFRMLHHYKREPVNSSHCKIVWRVDRRVRQCCDELAVLFDLAFVEVQSAT